MKSLLFDLDGTLNESGEGIKKSVQYAYEQLGYEIPPFDTLDMFVGPPLRDSFVQRGIPAEQAELAIVKYRERYTTIGIFECAAYEGIYELLQKLKEEGYRLFVATSKPEQLAIRVLEHLKMDTYFEIIAGATFDKSRDSKTQVIQYLLDQAHIEEPVMVGDTKFDVTGARKLDIPCIGVTWGYGTREEMEVAGAYKIVDTMDELYNVIKEM